MAKDGASAESSASQLVFDQKDVNRFDDHFDVVALFDAQFVQRLKRHDRCHSGSGWEPRA